MFAYNRTWLRYAWQKWLSAYYQGGLVVDMGCGIGVNGAITRELGARGVLGIDRDWGCLLESKSRGLTIVRADVTALPFRPASADLVLLIHVIEHFPFADVLLAGAHALLRPGGALVVVTPNWRRNPDGFLTDPTHRHPYTPESLAATLDANGFIVRLLKPHNVLAGVGRTSIWRLVPQLCFSGDALFALAERPVR